MSGGVPGTPLPWAVFHRELRKGVFGEVASDFIHAGPEPKDDTGFNVVARAYTTHGFDGIAEREANAAFIVLACNCHAELLEALEGVAACMLNGSDGQEGDFGWKISQLTKLRPAIRAVILKARGAQS